MSGMRICLVNPFFHPYVGGIENHIQAIATRLSRSHEVHVVTSQLPGTCAEEDLRGVEIHRLPTRFFPLYRPPATVTRGIRRKIAEISPDIIHAHHRWSPDYQRGMASFFGTRPVVFTWHNDFAEGAGPQRPFSLLNDSVFTASFAGRCSKVICICTYIRNRLIQRGLSGDATRVIYNGVDIGRPSHQEGDYALFIGRLVQTKGLDVLARVAKQGGVKVVVCGTGPLYGSLKHAPGLRLLGQVAENDKARLLRECMFLVLPSRSESFGLVLLEAMAVAKPVVATRVGGVPEVVADGGIIVEPADAGDLARAMDQLSSDASLRRELGRKAYKRARSLSWDKTASEVESVYEEVLGQAPSESWRSGSLQER